MKVSIDAGLCYGSAECAHRAPSVFAFEDGYGVVRPGRADTGDAPLVREAAERCPSQAIRITEDTAARISEDTATGITEDT